MVPVPVAAAVSIAISDSILQVHMGYTPPYHSLNFRQCNAVLLQDIGDIMGDFDVVPRCRDIVCNLWRVVLVVLADSEVEKQLATGAVLKQK